MKFIIIVSIYESDLREYLIDRSFVTSKDLTDTEWLRELELDPNWYCVDIFEYKEL